LPHFTASDGARIAYEDQGRGQPLLLLHGLMANRHFFRFQQPLGDDFRLVSPDLRGHGDSLGPNVTVEQLASDVAALAEHLDLKGVIGVGWSLGASILWQVLTGPASSRFAASIVVDMTPKVLNEGDWQLGLSEELCEARSAAIRDNFESFALSAGQAIFAQPLDDRTRQLAPWAGEEFARNDAASMGSLWASLMKQDLRPLLHDIAQPALIIRGAHSQLYGPDTADYLTKALPCAEALEFHRSGHAPHVEQPEPFNAAVREFAAKLPRVRENQLSH